MNIRTIWQFLLVVFGVPLGSLSGFTAGVVLATASLYAAPGAAQQFTASTCQKASDRYGIVANKTFGFAPQSVENWWVAEDCESVPLNSNSSCQIASNLYGIDAYVTWGFAPAEVQTWWKNSACKTHPNVAPISSTCQKASDLYGMSPADPGFAPSGVQSWWQTNGCKTVPMASKNPCQIASNIFGINANVSWGFAPSEVQTWWKSRSCFTHPQSWIAIPATLTGTINIPLAPPVAGFGCGNIAVIATSLGASNVPQGNWIIPEPNWQQQAFATKFAAGVCYYSMLVPANSHFGVAIGASASGCDYMELTGVTENKDMVIAPSATATMNFPLSAIACRKIQ